MSGRKKIKKRKPSLYNMVLKRFTAINNKLPENQKLSLERRRQIIKQNILPALKSIPISRVRVKNIKSLIQLQLGTMPMRSPEQCNINNIPPENYGFIQWFDIDETIQRLLPDCIYVRVSAGRFGKTKIFNTRNYNYYLNGVQQITEKIRKEVKNKSGAYYNGRQTLRPRKKNDGQSDSYFIDFVLNLSTATGDSIPQAPELPIIKYEPKTKREQDKAKKASEKVGNELDVIFNKLSKEKQKRSRAYREVRKDEQRLKKIVEKRITPANEVRILGQFDKRYNLALMKLKRYLDKGTITPARYEKALKQLKEFYNKINE